MYTVFSKSTNPLSNEYKYTFIWKGNEFVSVNHALLYFRAILAGNYSAADLILKYQNTWHEYENLIENLDQALWESKRETLLQEILMAKFSKGEPKEYLLDTPGRIIFASSTDKELGIGYSVNKYKTVDETKWGKNKLGILLEKIRDLISLPPTSVREGLTEFVTGNPGIKPSILTLPVESNILDEFVTVPAATHQDIIDDLALSSDESSGEEDDKRYWKTLEWPTGPYFPNLYFKPRDTVLIGKLTGTIALTARQEQIAELFTTQIQINPDLMGDATFKTNFWNDFKLILGEGNPFKSVDEINWTSVIDASKKRAKEIPFFTQNEIDNFSIIILNGIKTRLKDFTIRPAALLGVEYEERRGEILLPILPKMVTINQSADAKLPEYEQKRLKGFETDPYSRWIAKWTNPNGTISTINLPQLSDLNYESSDDESTVDEYEDLESEDEFSDHQLAEPDDEGDESDESDAEESRQRVVRFKQSENVAEDDDFITGEEKIYTEQDYKINYEITSNSEQNLLPFSYILSKYEQDKILDRAYKSGFSDVSNLAKVLDYWLEDYITHNLSTDDEVNGLFLQYAQQRGLFEDLGN